MQNKEIKEIGIRKVLGASVSGIVQLLSKDFLKLVFIAIVIATPVAWWAMNKWLQAFCVQDRYQLVDVCCGRVAGNFNCIVYGKLPGNKSSNSKPGEEFKNRIKW